MACCDSDEDYPINPAVVLEIGSRITKFGFVGEPSPKVKTRSAHRCPLKGEIRKIMSYEGEADLYSLLVGFIQKLYNKADVERPKDNNVVIVETLGTPPLFRNTLAKVFYHHFQVSTILFVPSHLMACYADGTYTGVVIDIGYKETRIIPVNEGVAVLSAMQTHCFAGEAIDKRLKDCLEEKYESIRNAHSDPDRQSDVDTFTENVLEEIKVRLCKVPNLLGAWMIAHGKTPIQNLHTCCSLPRFNAVEITPEFRQTIYEPMFEKHKDRLSLPQLIVEALLQSGIDTQEETAAYILIIGGTAMATGLRARLIEEISALAETPEYSERLSQYDFTFPFGANQIKLCWQGGSYFAEDGMLQLRGLTRERFLTLNQEVPDWSVLGTDKLEP